MRRFRTSVRVILMVTTIAAAVAAAACTREVEVPATVVVERTVVVEKPVQVTKVVEKPVEVTKVVEKPVEVTKVVQQTVVVVQTATPVPATATPTPKPKAAVNFVIGMPSDITSTNIWNIQGPAATTWNIKVFGHNYAAPYGLSDQRFDIVPQAAASPLPELKQEGAKWTISIPLQKGIKWSDGTELAAADVAFTAMTALELKLPGNWSTSFPSAVLEKVEATDASTVKYTFSSKPGLAQWQYGAAQAPIVQKKFWEPVVVEAKKNTDLAKAREVLFTAKSDNEPVLGPVIFKKWEKGAFVETTKNPSYAWAGSTLKNYSGGGVEETTSRGTIKTGQTTGDVTLEVKRGPNQDSITFNIYGTQDAAVLALRGGNIDYFLSPLGLTAGLRAQLTGRPGIGNFQNPSNGFRYISFNTRRAPLDDVAFRQAVAILIDKNFITQDILQRTAEPVETIVPSGNGYWHNPKVKTWGVGLSREARIKEVVTLLKANGYTWDKEPTWNADDRRVVPGSGLKKGGVAVRNMELLAPSAGYDPLRATAAIWIEQWLRDAGIPITANLTGFNVIVDKVFTNQDFDIQMLGWGLSIYPSYLDSFFSGERTNKGDNNAGGWVHPEFEKLRKEFLAETDLTKARDQAFKMQEFLANDLPYVTLFTVPVIEFYRPDKVKFPYTDRLDGVQSATHDINGMFSSTNFN